MVDKVSNKNEVDDEGVNAILKKMNVMELKCLICSTGLGADIYRVL